jgi:hypothetical protein
MIPPRRSRPRQAHRATLLGIVAVLALLAGAPAALAASPSIAITTTTGQSDPVAWIPRVFTVSGTAPTSERLYVKHRAAGGGPCAPSPYTDSGSAWTGFYDLPVNGAFSFQKVITWDAIGNWTFCFWLAPNQESISTPVAQTVSFRMPTGSFAPATISPLLLRPDVDATITIAGVSEAPRFLFAKVKPADAQPCALSYDAEQGQSLINGEMADGAFTGRRIMNQESAGAFQICFWLAGATNDPLPIAIEKFTYTVQRAAPLLSSATPIDCSTRRTARRFRAASVKSLCMLYRFSRAPSAGSKLRVSYVAPGGRTYKTVTVTWPSAAARALTARALPATAYKRRHGLWRAVVKMGGKKVKTVSFRVT